MRSFWLLLVGALLASCSNIPFNPEVVVPTRNPLPYSVKVTVSGFDSYLVEPGSSMVADPKIQNHIVTRTGSLGSKKDDWEGAILEYLAARQTFRQVTIGASADLDLTMRIIVYIDPSVQYKFNHMYVALTEASVRDPRNGRALISYSGFGKAPGEVSRGGKGDDAMPIDRAVHASLNDLFGKMEADQNRLSML